MSDFEDSISSSSEEEHVWTNTPNNPWEDQIQQVMSTSLQEYESSHNPNNLTVTCMYLTTMTDESYGPEQSYDSIYLPSNMARQVYTNQPSNSIQVFRIVPLVTIPPEDPASSESTIDIPLEDPPFIWAVLRGFVHESAGYLNNDTVDALCEAGVEFPVKCQLEPVTSPIPMGTRIVLRPLDRRFIELKDQLNFISGSIGKHHKVLWTGQIIRVFSSELGETIRLIVQEAISESMPGSNAAMLIQVTDCDLAVDFDIPLEWIKKPELPKIEPPVIGALNNTNEEPEQPVARLTPAELRAQRLAYFANKK